MRAILLIALSACAVDNLAETDDELEIKPKPPTQQVCFLSGVHQALSDGRANCDVIAPPVGSTAAVTNTGATTGTVEAVCVNVVQSTIHTLQWGTFTDRFGNTTVHNDSYTGNADTRCFLQSVYGENLGGCQVGSDTLAHDGNTWSWNGSAGAAFGNATAICFDWHAGVTGHYVANTTIPLLTSYPSGTPIPTGTFNCGLTSLTGNWAYANQAWVDTTGPNMYFDVASDCQTIDCFK